MNTKTALYLIAGTLLCSIANADLNVLFVGSSHTYSENSSPGGMVSQKAFNPEAVADELRNILTNDVSVTEPVNVVFEEVYKSAVVATGIGGWTSPQFKCDVTEYRCHSLAQYYMWPAGIDDRHDNLRGASGTAWDYVIITGDPYIMANFPGMYAEGVDLVATEVAGGTATPILLAQWPENSSSWSADDFNEIVYRVAACDGYTVVPGGKAWDTLSPQDSDSAHPTPDGAYLAAACIYSELFSRSATNSAYSYDSDIADHALSVVQTNNGMVQYAGVYTNANAFQMKHDFSRHFDFNHTGSSTEDGFQNRLQPLLTQCKVSYTKYGAPTSIPADKRPINFNYGRGNSMFEAEKRYDGDNCNQGNNYYSRAYGFPMQDHSWSAETSMEYGMDWRWLEGGSNPYVNQFDDGTDIGIANRILLRGEVPYDVRSIPIRLMLAKARQIKPGMSIQKDTWHFSDWIDNAADAFLYALQTGRCAIDDEPANQDSTDWNEWLGRKIGYETAWQISHLTTRAPGLRVLPTSSSASDVTPEDSQILSVKFTLAPTSEVSVAVSVDDRYSGIASPSVLTFTPANYSNEQTVTVWGETGPAGTYSFNVTLTTSSDDPAYEGCHDSWDFSNTRPEGPVPSAIQIVGDGLTIINGDMTPESANGTDFGHVSIPGAAASQMLVITNSSDTTTIDLTNSPAVMLTGGSGQFSLTQDALDTSLAPGEFTTFVIEFDPSAPGSYTSTVTVASTDPDRPIYTFAVRGDGVGYPTAGSETVAFADNDQATLGGALTSGGFANAYICWGLTDAGTSDTSHWAYVEAIGPVTQDEVFSRALTGLETNVSYWYRCYVANAAGEDWSDDPVPFSGKPVGGSGVILSVDFDSLATGEIDGGGSTLAQLNEATTGGSWSLEGGVTHEIQADSNGTEDQGFLSGPASAGSAGATVILSSAIDVDGLVSNVVITFTSGYTKGTGFTRDAFWKLMGGSTDLVTIEIDDGTVYANTSNIGSLHGGSDGESIGTTWNTASSYLLDFEITIDNAGNVDVSVSDHGPGANTVSGSTSFNPADDFDRIQTSWAHGPMGIYFGEILIAGLAPPTGISGTSVQNLAPTSISDSSATFQGALNSLATNAVFVHWGTTDGETNFAWDNSLEIGTWTNVTWSNMSHLASLSPGTTYYYTFRATNEQDNVWASPSWRFTTTGTYVPPGYTTNHFVSHAWLAALNSDWTNAYETAATNDYDEDGFFTWEEYWSGTDPRDKDSFLQIDAVQYDGSNVVLQWRHAEVDPSIPPIAIERTTNLETGRWTHVGEKDPLGGTNTWFMPSPDGAFYRIVATNTP